MRESNSADKSHATRAHKDFSCSIRSVGRAPNYADLPFRQNRKVHVADVSSGAEVPSQMMRFGNRRILRVAAENVPSVGYKVYEIGGGAGVNFNNAATVSGNAIENEFYRLTLANDGSITSLIDKQCSRRETVRAINGRVLNDLGGNRGGTVTIENAGAASVTLRAISASPLAHTTRVTLFRNSNRTEIENQITQNFGDVKTWSFSFDINSPDVWHEEVGAVIRGKLTTNGGHYSTKNARYDWLTMNHFADLSDGADDFGGGKNDTHRNFYRKHECFRQSPERRHQPATDSDASFEIRQLNFGFHKKESAARLNISPRLHFFYKILKSSQ